MLLPLVIQSLQHTFKVNGVASYRRHSMLYKVFNLKHIPFLPKHYSGITIGFLIFVRDNVADDVIPHELVHVKQFWRNPLMPLLYLLSKKKRYKYEVEAYRESIKHGRNPMNCAYSLVNSYKLNVTAERALKDLTNRSVK